MERYMKRYVQLSLFVFLTLVLATASGCGFLGKRTRIPTNYYVLDYLPATENPKLVQAKPFDKTIEVMETKLSRTYDRNQIVQKKSYTQISYFTNDLWANRLYDAVPNLMVRRLNAYNIFRRVSRDMKEASPDYYLETVIHNIEKVDIDKPQAFLRMEFTLRDAVSSAIIFTNRHERTQMLYDNSIEYLVQSFNQMIMYETDIFAIQCIDFLSGKKVRDSLTSAKPRTVNEFHEEEIEFEESGGFNTGQLFIPMLMSTENPVPVTAVFKDTLSVGDTEVTGFMHEIMTLQKGKWRVTFGPQNLSADVDISSNMRKVLTPFWGELLIRVLDESQTRVRMQYDIYSKSPGQDAFDTKVDFRYSPADEIGEYDYLWVLKPGRYMITLNGASPNAYRDFTTINLEAGKPYELTMIVNPEGERSVLMGAGVLTSAEFRRLRLHKGAVHTNINFSSNNSVDRDNPIRSISLSSQFDNKVDYDVWPIHFTMKSLYDLGFDKSTGTDFRVNVDTYSLRNALVFYPWKENKFLKNLGMYGRGDMSTHFFDEYVFFQNERNYIKVSQEADTLYIIGAKKLQVKDAFYPMRLKEGTGLTYRLNLSPRISMNLRSGFGWQQDYENSAYYYVRDVTIGGNVYEYYQENSSSNARGIEASLLLTMNNLLKIVSISSNLDVLFPMGAGNRTAKYDNENLINIRLYRNISLDIKANISYNKPLRDYVLIDYNAFLRLSLYY